MSTLKYSRQRESIKHFLSTRKDHPTADTVYMHIREEFPKISLGTVYRNLALLSDIGEITKIITGDAADRFDFNTMPHNHFVCTTCKQVLDLEMENIDHIMDVAQKSFEGEISGHITHFFGVCGDCIKKS